MTVICYCFLVLMIRGWVSSGFSYYKKHHQITNCKSDKIEYCYISMIILIRQTKMLPLSSNLKEVPWFNLVFCSDPWVFSYKNNVKKHNYETIVFAFYDDRIVRKKIKINYPDIVWSKYVLKCQTLIFTRGRVFVKRKQSEAIKYVGHQNLFFFLVCIFDKLHKARFGMSIHKKTRCGFWEFNLACSALK